MSASTTVRPSSRAAVLDRAIAMRLAATEYGRFEGVLRSLGPADWARPTDCPDWDVRAHGRARARNGPDGRRGPLARRAERGGDPRGWGHRRPDVGAGPEDGAALRRRTRRPVRGRRTAGGARPAPTGPRDRAASRCRRTRSSASSGNGGRSATSSTSSSPATPGCTAPTSVAPSAARWNSRPSTTASSSPTSSRNGPSGTAAPYRLRLTGPAGGEWAAGDGRAGARARRRGLLSPAVGPRCGRRPARPAGSLLSVGGARSPALDAPRLGDHPVEAGPVQCRTLAADRGRGEHQQPVQPHLARPAA